MNVEKLSIERIGELTFPGEVRLFMFHDGRWVEQSINKTTMKHATDPERLIADIAIMMYRGLK